MNLPHVQGTQFPGPNASLGVAVHISSSLALIHWVLGTAQQRLYLPFAGCPFARQNGRTLTSPLKAKLGREGKGKGKKRE